LLRVRVTIGQAARIQAEEDNAGDSDQAARWCEIEYTQRRLRRIGGREQVADDDIGGGEVSG
jgi:hypothetical protein